MLIARRADTRASADFATWKMMAKLNGASALPHEAQAFLESYKVLLKADDGGRGDRGHHQARCTRPTTARWAALAYRPYSGQSKPPGDGQRDRLQTPCEPAPERRPAGRLAASDNGPLPVALIFGCLVWSMSGSGISWFDAVLGHARSKPGGTNSVPSPGRSPAR